ncbi:cyclin [Castilleja foliolosa]
MLHVIHQVEPCNGIEYENQLLGVLKISKDEVDDCYEIISDVISNRGKQNPVKRKLCQVMDAIFSCDDGSSSNDSLFRARLSVSEARLSVKQFCKTLLGQIEGLI